MGVERKTEIELSSPAPLPASGYVMKLVHPKTGELLPPLLSTKQTADILNWHEHSVMSHCALGLIATLPRVGSAPWQIVTAKLLRSLGLDPEGDEPEQVIGTEVP